MEIDTNPIEENVKSEKPNVGIFFDSPEALLESLCIKIYGAIPIYNNPKEED